MTMPADVDQRATIHPLATKAGPSSLSALPKSVGLSLYAGDDFYLRLVVRDADGADADLSDCEVESQVRRTYRSDVAAEFSVGINGNVISLHLASDDTAQLPLSCVYDVRMVDGAGRVLTLLAGAIDVTQDVTRNA